MEVPDDAPAPRLCQIIQWPDFDGYGFNLHAEKIRSGQFIGKVDEDSPAELGGLRCGDRIIEVNNVNIANENHKQVVARIKAVPKETKLLVLDEVADEWYKERNIVVKGTMKNVIHLKTPVPRPGQEGTNEIVTSMQEVSLQSSQDVDEESGESVRNLDEGISNGNVKDEPTTEDAATVEKEKSSFDEQPPESSSPEVDEQPPESSVVDERPPESTVVDEQPPESSLPNVPPLGTEGEEKVITGDNFKNEDDAQDEKVNNNAEDVKNNEESTAENNKKNDLEDDGGLSKDDIKVESRLVIEDELKTEPPKSIEGTPPSDKKYLQESPQSSRSSEHRETPPTTPATPEPTVEKEIETTNNHRMNGQSNGQSKSLNLNMSAQEMRQMLAQRKKRDVRKDQMDMRTKFDMIQKM